VRHRYRRDKVSAISAVTVSPERRRFGLYLHLHPGENISTVEVAIFLRALLRHLRGHVIVLLDGGSIHKGPEVQALTARCSRLHLEWFPGYAPELNPDEWVWAHLKAKLANGHPNTLDDLSYGPDAANVLFRFVNDSYLHRRPMIFTTNKPLGAWGRVLHDPDLAEAILDRVLERGRHLELRGPSYRTRHVKLDLHHDLRAPSGPPTKTSGNQVSEFPEPTRAYMAIYESTTQSLV
jgi:transposase